MNLKDRSKRLKEDIPAVILAIKHKKTPWYAKTVAAVALAYALSPIDLIPDFIPVLGYLDDILILPALIALFIKLIPTEVIDECRDKAQESIGAEKWYYAIPVILIWCLIIYLIAKAIFIKVT